MERVTTSGKDILEVRNQVIKLLADESCTVQQAKYTLTQAKRAIVSTASVQPISGTDYEF